MIYQTDYYWVVICKNHRFHRKGNLGYEHHIALGETDAISPLPMLTQQIKVRCDNCGEEHIYQSEEILRAELQIAENFVPHPLFRSGSR